MNTVTWYSTFLRASLTLLDACAYSLLNNVYMLFYAVIATEPVPGSVITGFFNRIRLLLGIFIMFQLAMTVIKGIVNPETFTNDKTGGGHVISRIIISLMLLTLMVPIGINSPKNEFERQIHNKGLLFGTLDSLQTRILNNHVIENLVFGYNIDSENKLFSNNENDRYEGLKNYSNRLTSRIAKTFYPINTKDPYGDPKDPNQRVWWIGGNLSLASFNAEDIYALYNAGDDDDNPPTPAYTLLQMAIYSQCTVNENGGTKDYYAFDMNMVIVPGIIGFVMIWVILSLTFEVAVRSIKLAFLRLIAPIPIISYMNPSGSKDGAFNAWVKLLGTTYLELFLKLTVIYFVLNISNEILSGTMTFFVIDANPMLAGIVTIVMILALMIFAKEADKFIKQALGMKDNGGKFFSAMGKAMGIGASFVSTPGNFMAGYRASLLADKTRESYGDTDIFGRRVDPNSGFNRAKHLLAGIYGGASGVGVGSKAALEAKDHYLNASWEAMQKRNAAALARGNDGSTLLGRLGSTFSSAIMGEGSAAETERQINAIKTRVEHLKNAQNAAKNETIKQDWTRAAVSGYRDIHGASLDHTAFNLKQFNADLAKYDAMGGPTGKFKDFSGVEHEIDMSDAKRMQGLVEKFNQDDFMQQQYEYTQGHARADTKVNYEYLDQVRSAEVYGGSADFVRSPDGTIKQTGNKRITNRESVWDAIRDFTALTDQMKRSNEMKKANDRHSGNDKKG